MEELIDYICLCLGVLVITGLIVGVIIGSAQYLKTTHQSGVTRDCEEQVQFGIRSTKHSLYSITYTRGEQTLQMYVIAESWEDASTAFDGHEAVKIRRIEIPIVITQSINH